MTVLAPTLTFRIQGRFIDLIAPSHELVTIAVFESYQIAKAPEAGLDLVAKSLIPMMRSIRAMRWRCTFREESPVMVRVEIRRRVLFKRFQFKVKNG